MENETEKKGFFSQFIGNFWVTNSLELFERGAYYGTMAVLSVHAVKNLHISYSTVGLLYSMLIILLYFMPLISAALAEKYGYRNTLLVSFIILIAGYFLLFLVQPDQLAFLILALITVGIGAGAFKPIISASIAHQTTSEQRNLAYSIYYWMINLGAFLMPLTIGFFLGEQHLFYFVFLISTVLITTNLIITIFLYKDPVQPQKDLSINRAIKRIVPALRDKKFVILLIIYSGFWFMFAVNHSFLPTYMVDFQRMPSWFVVPFLATINPGTIILVGPFLGKLVEKHKSLNMVILGIIIFSLGITIVGFSNNPYLFIIGIIVFSFGEFITHPGFIAYVSKIAPKDMVAIYMACIFIATGTGNAVGGAVQGFWYENIAVGAGMPKVFFALIASVGLLTLISFILYNRWIISEAIKIDPTAVPDRGIWTKGVTIGVILLFIPVTVGAAYVGGPNTFYGDGEELGSEFTWDDYQVKSKSESESAYLNEGSSDEFEIQITQNNLLFINFTLIWEDEPDSSALHNNQVDTFSFEVELPDLTTHEADETPSGNILLFFKNTPEEDPDTNGTGIYTVTITCVEAGDQELIRSGPFRAFDEADNGNQYTMLVEYQYYEK